MQPPQKTVKDYLKNKQYLQILKFIFTYFVSKYFNNRHFYYKQVFKSVLSNKNTYDIAIAYQGPTDSIDFYIANKVQAAQKISWAHFDVSKHYVNMKLYRRLYKKFDWIYVVSTEAKQQLIKQFPGVKTKAKTFMNIVPAALIREMAEENSQFDETYRGLKIVTVGRLSMKKGQDMAIKALARLKKRRFKC